jgi:transcriptional regulator with XRE-family HTH domain
MKGSDVKRILKAYGYTQTSVAKTIGTTPKALNEALSSDNIRIELLKRIAKAIGKAGQTHLKKFCYRHKLLPRSFVSS